MVFIKWFFWIFIFCVFIFIVFLVFLYVDVYIECWKFINDCFKIDLLDIDKLYMLSKGFYMWVVEWNGKIVGMVGVIYNEIYKLGVVEL